ncbi:MAG: ribosome small subunit-dependent GTPase A, partial [Clostridium sp.]
MKGKIIKGIGGFYYIKTDEGVIECKARGKFRHKSLKPMVGDNVEIKIENGKGVIEDIEERNSELFRPTVANVTRAFVVFAMKNPDINYDLLNRFLLLCESNNIEAIVCLNKMDLVSEEERKEIKEKINEIGYEVLFINAKEGIGVESLKERLEGNVTVLCGPSGAGKST